MTRKRTPQPEIPQEPIPFTPVPVRARRDGWTEERQRGFIAALQRIGSATAAARQVGKTRRSAYKLRDRPGAESFARAWDKAAGIGRVNLHDHVIDRALNGALVPVFRAGRQTGTVFRYYDGLACAVLGGRALELRNRVDEAWEAGQRSAFFNIERQWRFDKQRINRLQDDLIVAEDKLKRLAAAGLIGPEWLERGRPAQDCPPPARPAPERRRAVPRIRML